MDSKAYFNRVLPLAGGCIQHITTDKLSNRTPCSKWNLKILLNHMISELLWLTELLDGKTISQVGKSLDGDLLDRDLAKTWNMAIYHAKKSVKKVDLKMEVGLSYGKVSAAHYLNEISSDLLIHGWDVAQSINCSLIIPKNLVQVVYDFYKPQEVKLKSSGLFGEKITPNVNAPLLIKLLSVVGRTSS